MPTHFIYDLKAVRGITRAHSPTVLEKQTESSVLVHIQFSDTSMYRINKDLFVMSEDL